MHFTDIKTTKVFADNLGIAWRELVEKLESEVEFTIDGSPGEYRFIATSYIDAIMQDELESDKYILGCFNANFLTHILNAPIEAIEAMQKAEAYEALGIWIIQSGKIEELQQKYVSADGYGHYFASYDSNELELTLEDQGLFHVFRTN